MLWRTHFVVLKPHMFPPFKGNKSHSVLWGTFPIPFPSCELCMTCSGESQGLTLLTQSTYCISSICLPLTDVWEGFKNPRSHQSIQRVDKLEEARLSEFCQLSTEPSHAWSHLYFQSKSWQTVNVFALPFWATSTAYCFPGSAPRFSHVSLFTLNNAPIDEVYVIQWAGKP